MTKADKCNTSVPMDKNKCTEEITTILSDETTYIPLEKDPTNTTQNKVKNLIKLWKDKNYINDSPNHLG